MDRKRLLVLGGLAVVVALALRRWTRRDAVGIEEPRPRDRPTGAAPVSVDLESIEGIGPAYAGRLREAGVADGADLVAADAEALAAETGIAERRIRGWVERTVDRGAA